MSGHRLAPAQQPAQPWPLPAAEQCLPGLLQEPLLVLSWAALQPRLRLERIQAAKGALQVSLVRQSQLGHLSMQRRAVGHLGWQVPSQHAVCRAAPHVIFRMLMCLLPVLGCCALLAKVDS